MSKNFLSKLKPGLPKGWLLFFAGAMWVDAGSLLISYTFVWLENLKVITQIGFVATGVILALTIYKFGFSKLGEKNIKRIMNIESDRPCVFAFQQWSSYPVVIFMISLGIFLRKYSPIPKMYLAILYIGIGGSLFLASFQYFFKLFQKKK